MMVSKGSGQPCVIFSPGAFGEETGPYICARIQRLGDGDYLFEALATPCDESEIECAAADACRALGTAKRQPGDDYDAGVAAIALGESYFFPTGTTDILVEMKTGSGGLYILKSKNRFRNKMREEDEARKEKEEELKKKSRWSHAQICHKPVSRKPLRPDQLYRERVTRPREFTRLKPKREKVAFDPFGRALS